MIRLHFVGDGERDSRLVPPLVSSILQNAFEHTAANWPRLQKRGGLPGKVRYAVIQARQRHANGLVATVDRDNDPKRNRLKKMEKGRSELRKDGVLFPIALGEADPHMEAWLLDDPKAVRDGLSLPSNTEIPNVNGSKYPKNDLDTLVEESDMDGRPIEILLEVAKLIDAERCSHKKETGFEAFLDELHAEIGPLLSNAEQS